MTVARAELITRMTFFMVLVKLKWQQLSYQAGKHRSTRMYVCTNISVNVWLRWWEISVESCKILSLCWFFRTVFNQVYNVCMCLCMCDVTTY